MPRFDRKRHCVLFRGGGIDHRCWEREAILNFDFTIRHRSNNDIFQKKTFSVPVFALCRVYKQIAMRPCYTVTKVMLRRSTTFSLTIVYWLTLTMIVFKFIA